MYCAKLIPLNIASRCAKVCTGKGIGNPYGYFAGPRYCKIWNCTATNQRVFTTFRGLKNCELNPRLLSKFHFLHKSKRVNIYFIRQFYRRYSNKPNNTSLGDTAVKTPNKNTKNIPSTSEVRRLFQLAKPEKWKLTVAVILLVISSGVSMSIPFCMGKVIDTIYSSSHPAEMTTQLKFICKILFGVFIIGGIANFGRVYLINISGTNIVKRLREMLFTSIIKQEVGFFDKTKTGELINRLSTDTSMVGTSVTMNISDGLRAVAQGVGGVGMMLYVSPKLTGIALVVVLPVVVMSRIYGRYLRSITKQMQDSLADATQVAEERISNIRTVRSFGMENREMEAYSGKIEEVLKISYKEALAKGIFWGSTGLSGNMIILAVLYSGGMMMQESMITVGDLSAFLLYAAYAGVSLGGMTTFYTEMMKGLGASTRLWFLTDRKTSIPISGGVVPAVEPIGDIEFKNIDFSYPSRLQAPIFSGLNLSVPAGSVTAVVGSSGSGKSTLGALLLRFYDPITGTILLDGQELRTLDPHWVRKQIGSVSQEPILFSCSIAENIAYGALDPQSVSLADIENAARQANAFNFINSFPKGFDTIVGERGMMLSGGQRQRIAIARAILKDPKILLLDEATSALDAESEYLVQEALERLMVGRTVITIAHRLSTIKTANQIAVLDKGQIAEIGSYGELMGITDGIFKRLVERQTITR